MQADTASGVIQVKRDTSSIVSMTSISSIKQLWGLARNGVGGRGVITEPTALEVPAHRFCACWGWSALGKVWNYREPWRATQILGASPRFHLPRKVRHPVASPVGGGKRRRDLVLPSNRTGTVFGKWSSSTKSTYDLLPSKLRLTKLFPDFPSVN